MPEPKPQPDRDFHHEDESDRRGEHVYPTSERDKEERPSQQQRDKLKERLEKRSQ